MSIYAILGVEFFMNYGENGSYTNELGEVVEITTARDLQYGSLDWNLLEIWVWLEMTDCQCVAWWEDEPARDIAGGKNFSNGEIWICGIPKNAG